MTSLSIVIPAYNESARLPALLDVLSRTAECAVQDSGLELHEILIVDDGSTDGTAELLRVADGEMQKLSAVTCFAENMGKGAAVAEGVRRAEGDQVLLADVDLSTPLEELGKLTAAMRGGADVAIGSRAIDGSLVERGPVHRKLLGKAFNSTVRALTRLDVRDTQCGFKLLPADTARRLFADQICPGFAFDVELLIRADLAGLRVAEVPVLYVHDPRSSVRVVSASIRMLRDTSRLAYRLRIRNRRHRAFAAGSLGGLAADDSD
jgi:dolichyl-phosphate beta-glucosyltransferase